MGHHIEAVVGSPDIVGKLVPGNATIPLLFGLALVPHFRFYPNEDDFESDYQADGPYSDELLKLSSRFAERLRLATSDGGSLVYLETDYFGGTGTQAAIAWKGGKIVVPPTRAAGGIINTALREIGVARASAPMFRRRPDEFDTLGLGQFRDFDREMEAVSWWSNG